MADFCWNCAPDMFGIEPERNDLAGLCSEEQMVSAICESCGPGWFDHLGKPVPPLEEDEEGQEDSVGR